MDFGTCHDALKGDRAIREKITSLTRGDAGHALTDPRDPAKIRWRNLRTDATVQAIRGRVSPQKGALPEEALPRRTSAYPGVWTVKLLTTRRTPLTRLASSAARCRLVSFSTTPLR